MEPRLNSLFMAVLSLFVFSIRGLSFRRRFHRAGFSIVALALFALVSPGSGAGTFTNPINAGPDPWMLYHEGNYYLTTTQGDCIRMWKASSLAEIKVAKPTLIWRDSDPSRSHGIWAPELHWI